MIVTQLLGGLGNQLFQYAVGRALAEKNRTRLKLDTSALAACPPRPYALQPFCIEADVLSSDELRELGLGEPSRTRLGRLLRRLRKPSLPVISERSFEFDPAVLDSRAPCYLKGYWQSPRYFAAIEAQIRRELTLAAPPDSPNAALAHRIRASPAVSVHVRRGDYVANAQTNRYHGACGAEYYHAAEKFLQSRVGALALFVFSDEPQWAQENLRFASPSFVVAHNRAGRAHEDLRLMSLCRHHIIANSTFSWWGAWLAGNAGKVVVAPRNWFAEGGHRTDDLIPKEWSRI